MSDSDGDGTSDEAAIWSSQRPPGFERQPASWPLPLRRALAERSRPIDGGRFAPLVHSSSSDAGARYELTQARDECLPRLREARKMLGLPAEAQCEGVQRLERSRRLFSTAEGRVRSGRAPADAWRSRAAHFGE